MKLQWENEPGLEEKLESEQTKKNWLRRLLAKSQGNYNWADVVGALTGIVTLAAFCTVSPALARYQGTDILLRLAQFSIGVLSVILLWELLCIFAGWNGKELLQKGWKRLTGNGVRILVVLLIVFGGILCWHFQPVSVEYYASVTEVYGVPAGAGEPLSQEELADGTGYWVVEDDPRHKRITLTYTDPYNQLELMRENSSAYGMSVFSAPARIVCEYTTDQGEFRRRLDAKTFTDASDAGILRMPKTTSYYSSSGKLLLRLEQSAYGKAKITAYSAGDTPQLLNSTLLRIPEDQSAGQEMTSLQIETVYRPDGLAESRRIAPYIYNKYGINGERYRYNERGQITDLCYLDVKEQPVCNKLGIMSVQFTYEEEGGPLRSVSYFSDENGTARTEGFYGASCEKFKYDNRFLKERQQLDRNGKWCYDKNQVCRYRYTYENGRLAREEFLGRENTAVQHSRFKTSGLSYLLENQEGQETLIVSYEVMGNTVREADIPETPVQTKTFPAELMPSAENLLEQTAQPMVLNRAGPQPPETADGGTGTVQNDPAVNDLVRAYSSVRYQIGVKDRHLLSTSYWNIDKPAVNEQGCAKKVFQYDSQQRTVYTFFYSEDGQHCPVREGYAGIKRTYQDEFGDRLKELQYLGPDGKTPVVNREQGYAVVQYQYTTQNQRETIRKAYFYYDKEKKKLLPANTKGYSVVADTYDERGFRVQIEYRDENDAPAYHNDYQVSSIFYEYSDNGELILEYYRDAEDVATNRADTGHAMIHQEFKAGHLVKRSYEGYRDGRLQALPDWTTGAVEIRYSYENGQNTRTEYRDAQGKLVLRNDTGYAVRKVKYDNNGNLCEERFFGTKNDPVLRWGYNYSYQVNGYNAKGQLESVRYYDTKGEPAVNTYYHCAGADYGYDDYGNRNEVRYIGPDGKLMIRSDLGYAQIKRFYDQGKIAKAEYFDTQGNPTPCKDGGYASYEDDYKNGNWVEGRYYDTEGNLMIRPDKGYSIVHNTFNDFGQRILQEYFAIDPETGEKVRVVSSEYHCAGIRTTYDDMGNQVKFKYLGLEDGELMIRSDLGYAIVEKDYDKGKVVSARYFDVQGEPILCKDGGYASFRDRFEKGRWIEGKYYDTEGNLTLREDYGYARRENKYDEFGKVQRINYYGTDGLPIISTYYHCAGFEYGYDTLGNRNKIQYIGLDGKLMIRSDLGYAQVESTCFHGEIVQEIYLNTEGKPVPQKNGGFTSLKSVYQDGFWMETEYYDANGNLMVWSENGAYTRNTYNRFGQRDSARFYGTDKKTPIISEKFHSAGFNYEYDEKGNQKFVYYIGLDGEQMTENDLGYVRKKKYYDALGQIIGEDYLDANGNPAVNQAGGYASYWKFYEDGKWIKTVYYDAKNELIVNQEEGFAKVKNIYGPQGRREFQYYYDTDGQTRIISPRYHSSGFKYYYDERGNLTDLWIYDPDEIVALQPGEYLLNYMVYDERDHRTWDSYYIWNEQDESYTLVFRDDLGYAAVENFYDKTLWTGKQYLDENRNPVVNQNDGYAIMERKYNDKGQLYRVYYYDEKRELIEIKDGYAVVEYKYDDSGNDVDWVYYDRSMSVITR